MSDYKITAPIYGVVSLAKPGKSLNLGWYRNAHYHTNNAVKKRFKKQISKQLLSIDHIVGKIRVDYHYYAKRKATDLDNFTSAHKKYFQDAMVELGLIADDNCNYIVETREKYMGIDKENPRLEIFIRKIEE